MATSVAMINSVTTAFELILELNEVESDIYNKIVYWKLINKIEVLSLNYLICLYISMAYLFPANHQPTHLLLITFIDIYIVDISHDRKTYHQSHCRNQTGQTTCTFSMQTHIPTQKRYYWHHLDHSQNDSRNSYELKKGECTVN